MGTWTGNRSQQVDDDTLPDLVEEGHLVLLHELKPAVDAFAAAATQWRWLADGWNPPRRMGMDYGGLRVAMAMSGIAETPELFGQVRVMEAAALQALAE